ncbi:hypothetical protein SDC9_210168 [bioreactor metagenome]|uniref:Uncharacterized protein n=1 Tax=bioreactor metagenome TaxID=1076179 RepID=A0A645JH31_9ZZZZ
MLISLNHTVFVKLNPGELHDHYRLGKRGKVFDGPENKPEK